MPHAGGALTAENGTPLPTVKRAADRFNMPVIVTKNLPHAEPIEQYTLVCDQPNVSIASLKCSEWQKNGSLIMRVVEESGVPAEAKIRFVGFPNRITTVTPVDLLERPIGEPIELDEEACLPLHLGKFEIQSFELSLQ
jgi:hypothetical protein